MIIATYGTIEITPLELIDYNCNDEFGYVEIGKIAGTAEIQKVSNPVSKIELKLRYYDKTKADAWKTEAITKNSYPLIIANNNFGNYYIKNIQNRIRGLIPYISDISINLWQIL